MVLTDIIIDNSVAMYVTIAIKDEPILFFLPICLFSICFFQPIMLNILLKVQLLRLPQLYYIYVFSHASFIAST